MDVNVRFWNGCRNIIETRYCNSKFLDGENFLQLAIDKPNVNWEVLKKTDEMLVKNDYSKTINVGSCPQHTIHGVFETGATNDWDIHKILKKHVLVTE